MTIGAEHQHGDGHRLGSDHDVVEREAGRTERERQRVRAHEPGLEAAEEMAEPDGRDARLAHARVDHARVDDALEEPAPSTFAGLTNSASMAASK